MKQKTKVSQRQPARKAATIQILCTDEAFFWNLELEIAGDFAKSLQIDQTNETFLLSICLARWLFEDKHFKL